MSIRFYCPTCGAPIAFQEKHIGKPARCLNCGQAFIIPPEDEQVPQKIKLETKTQSSEPLPGFYKALLLDSLKIFFHAENLTGR